MRNSLICAAGRETVNADMDSVLIAAPHWFNKQDVDAGAAQPSDLFFHESTYQRGNAAIGPGEVDISSYEAYVWPRLFDVILMIIAWTNSSRHSGIRIFILPLRALS